MKKGLSVSIFLVGFLAISCDPFFKCLDGNGTRTSEERVVSGFTGVVNTTSYDVTISYGSQTSVTVIADENLIQYIKTSVSGGNLILETDQNRCINSVNAVEVNIVCPYIKNLSLSGSGNMDITSFESDNFKCTLSGSGNIKISDLLVTNGIDLSLSGSGNINIDGKALTGKYSLSGSGNISAENMVVDDVDVILSGSGNIRTQFNNSLKGILSGSGDIYFYGDNTKVTIRVTGSGDVIQR